jgi:predicted alpha/beta-fold hydrolase
VRHWNADVNGISLHVAEQGPASGPVVLLLHGFPELWLSWRHQMVALAARGFRALAPDLRGYGDSSAPADPAAYSIFHIVGDIVALLDHLRVPKVTPFPAHCSFLGYTLTCCVVRTRCSSWGTTWAPRSRGTCASSGRIGCAPSSPLGYPSSPVLLSR